MIPVEEWEAGKASELKLNESRPARESRQDYDSGIVTAARVAVAGPQTARPAVPSRAAPDLLNDLFAKLSVNTTVSQGPFVVPNMNVTLLPHQIVGV